MFIVMHNSPASLRISLMREMECESTTALRQVLQRKHPLLVQYIDLPSLLPYMSARNFITSDEQLQLTKQWHDGFRQDAVATLLAVLQRKCPQWAEGLYEALEESVHPGNSDVHKGHEYVIEVVRREMDDAPSPPTQAKHLSSECACDCGCNQKIKALQAEMKHIKEKNSAIAEIVKTIGDHLTDKVHIGEK